MAKIIVTAKDNLGHSPKFGDIRKGQTYTIEETDFAPELFDAPDGFDTTPYEPKTEEVAAQPEAQIKTVKKPSKEVL